MTKPQTRDGRVDMLRGIAMLMVVLGHTMSGCTVDSQNSLLFNLIWALQMPLFMLISGYTVHFSPSAESGRALAEKLLRNIRAYLLPWAVWTILIRGLLLGQKSFLELFYLLWNMDSGYWFLFSIWVIASVLTVSRYLARRISGDGEGAAFAGLTLLFYLAAMVLLALLGAQMGMQFLCIKLTLYYMPFYFVGYWFGVYGKRLAELPWGRNAIKWTTVGCTAVFFVIVLRRNLYTIEDNLFGIALRGTASLCGCIAAASFVRLLPQWRGLLWVGRNTLQIYLIHYLFLCLVRIEPMPTFLSASGLAVTAGNFMLTLALTCGAAWLANSRQITRRLLFGNR